MEKKKQTGGNSVQEIPCLCQQGTETPGTSCLSHGTTKKQYIGVAEGKRLSQLRLG